MLARYHPCHECRDITHPSHAAILALTLTTSSSRPGRAPHLPRWTLTARTCSDEDVPPEAHHEAERIRDSLPAERTTATTGSRRRKTSTIRRSGTTSALRSRGSSRARRPKWVEGNHYYERVEGVVAGTPSLAVYDVILDAGSSAQGGSGERRSVRLKLADGRILRSPGTSTTSRRACSGGRSQSTRRVASRLTSTATEESSSGRSLPDASGVTRLLLTHSCSTRESSTGRVRAWKPTASDAFTAVA